MAEEPEVPFFYANVMQAHLGAFDFTIDFGYKKAEDQATTRFTPVCTVAMSLSHAKTMIPILSRLIAAYENQFGPIPAPGYDEQARE
jgi:Protein of unknown function (DUF3467)